MAFKQRSYLYEILVRFDQGGLKGAHVKDLEEVYATDTGKVVAANESRARPITVEETGEYLTTAAADAVAKLAEREVAFKAAQAELEEARVQALAEVEEARATAAAELQADFDAKAAELQEARDGIEADKTAGIAERAEIVAARDKIRSAAASLLSAVE